MFQFFFNFLKLLNNLDNKNNKITIKVALVFNTSIYRQVYKYPQQRTTGQFLCSL